MSNENTPETATPHKAPFIVVHKDDSGSEAIRIENLTVRLPGERQIELVRNVNFEIPRGERVIITGESGSGKSTVVKAILNGWNHGEGVIHMPDGLRTMVISQRVYLPNNQLRSIMNMLPEGQTQFEDRALRDVLQKVGLDRLVQHIPGQQVEVMIDDFLKKTGAMLDQYKGQDFGARHLKDVRRRMDHLIEDLADEQFDIVQYVPDAQRAYFKSGFKQLLADKGFGKTLPGHVQDTLTDDLLDKMDIALAVPLCRLAERMAVDIAKKAQKWKICNYSSARATSYAAELCKKIERRMQRYILNKDSEDPNRVILLNELQAAHVAWVLNTHVKKNLQKPVKKNALRYAFNAASLPVRLCVRAIFGRVQSARIKETMFGITNYMDMQVLRGERLAASLSGGQQKMLMAARVLLFKPDILLLDEITSGLDVKNGPRLYKEVMDILPKNSTVLSVLHNEQAYMKYHTLHARLDKQTITLEPVKAAKKPKRGPNPAP